jgi:GTP-binding protein HflX
MKDQIHSTTQAFLPVVLVLAPAPDERDHEQEREQEMRNLLDTAGRRVMAVVSQHLARPVGGTYIGSGKIAEVAELVATHGAVEAVFDVRLTPRQQRNLAEEIKTDIIDYDELILDIFASNARTYQAKLAVELAQLQYTRSRLRRMWTHLDRQSVGGSSGSGSGFKAGTGEKQIETDRRLIKQRIQDLKERLEEIEGRKERTVQARSDAFKICLVGYTNAGKSTLMNALTSAGVLAENRLFATLDTRSSKLFLDRHHNVVLSDTVGFIRKLPHSLIASFHATLAEVREADLLLHVVDSSSAVMEDQVKAVDEVLESIEAKTVPAIMVFNKSDQSFSRTLVATCRKRYKEAIALSALTGEGVEQLKDLIKAHIDRRAQRVIVSFPLINGALDAFVRSRTPVLEESYDEEKAVLTINADQRLLSELQSNPHLTVELAPE